MMSERCSDVRESVKQTAVVWVKYGASTKAGRVVNTQYEQLGSPSPDEEMGHTTGVMICIITIGKTQAMWPLVSVGILFVDCSTVSMFSGY